jgi:serine phosphatase RsbU (regulator of sigma subunit)
LKKGDVFVFCTDGIFEALNEEGVEFGATRLTISSVANERDRRRAIVDAIFDTVTQFRGTRPQGDDMTAVAVKITA